MAKNYWVCTRPKRKLIVIPDMLKVFQAVVEGEKWNGNREAQLDFEKELVTFKWKAENLSKDGSGARTYAALLFMLGLWYENENGVQLTNAGREIVQGRKPVPILTKQLIDFQYPSSYSLNRNVNIDPSFKVRPHRFIIRLFTEGGLDELTQDEVAFCIVPRAKKDTDIEKILELIGSFRNNPDKVKSESVQISGTTEDNLSNIGNTFLNQLEYTEFFEERDEIKILKIKPGYIDKAREAVEAGKDAFIGNPDNVETFQKRYGSGLDKSKDYTGTQISMPSINPNERAILLTYYEYSLNRPIDAITDELITEIAGVRGVSSSKVREVLSRLAQKPSLDAFEEQYIKLSKGGTETATPFEVRTQGLFSDEGFGLAAAWVGSKPRHPDIFVYFDKVNKEHGIIDTKAYKEYNLPLDHKNKMAYTYLPDFNEIVYEGDNYKLRFFNYVAGGFGSNMHNSFKELVDMCSVPGSYITSMNLVNLLRNHRRRQISTTEFCEIFSCNKEIVNVPTH